MNSKGKQASCYSVPSFPEDRGRQETARSRRQGAAAPGPSVCIFTKLWADCQFLNTSSWSWIFTPSRSVTVWDQLLWDQTHDTIGTVLLRCTWETECPGQGRCVKCSAHLGHGSPRMKSSEWLGPGSSSKRPAYLGLCPCVTPKNLSGLNLRSAKLQDSAFAEHAEDWLWKPYVIQPLEHFPHTSNVCLLEITLSFHRTIEQVSLSKWPPSPLHQGGEIRQWRDLQSEEPNKQGKATLEVTGNRLKPCS